MTSPSAQKRVCLRLQVQPELLAEYIDRHSPLGPETARFFAGLEGRPDQAAAPLSELFHLEDQLAAASITEEGDSR